MRFARSIGLVLFWGCLAFAPSAAGQSKPASQPASRPGVASKKGAPAGFRRVLPRGRIAAIRQPRYLAAAKANIAPQAWVLGVVIEGQARAYSLHLLNRHEIVNDTLGKTPFAAVW